MKTRTGTKAATWLAGGVATAAAAYAVMAGTTWYRFGRHSRPNNADSRLDQFMPQYDIVERHETRIAAPVDATFRAATTVGFGEAPVPRAIFKVREIVMGGRAGRNEPTTRGTGILEQAQAIGWGVLAEVPGRAVVFGAVTQPWVAAPVFRALPPGEFAAFNEPGYVKIAWTLSAREAGPAASVAETETRAVATDAMARSKFRWYWSLVRPGIVVIRWSLLGAVKSEAERQAPIA